MQQSRHVRIKNLEKFDEGNFNILSMGIDFSLESVTEIYRKITMLKILIFRKVQAGIILKICMT